MVSVSCSRSLRPTRRTNLATLTGIIYGVWSTNASGDSAVVETTQQNLASSRWFRKDEVDSAFLETAEVKKSPASTDEDNSVDVGARAQVYYSSRDTWYDGKVSAVSDTMVTINFEAPNGTHVDRSLDLLDVNWRLAGGGNPFLKKSGNHDHVHSSSASMLDQGYGSATKVRVETPAPTYVAPVRPQPRGATNYEVLVGFGPSRFQEKCIRTHEPVTCAPNAGNVDVRRNPDTTSEEFEITVSGAHMVCARRTDRAIGWTMRLEIRCNFQRAKLISMGTSSIKKKCIDAPEKLMCSWNAANVGIRAAEGNAQDEGSFIVDTMKAQNVKSVTRICVTRLDDKGVGWNFDLAFYCSVVDQDFKYEVVPVSVPISSKRSSKCFRVNEGITCPTNVLDWALDRVTDIHEPARFEVTSDFLSMGLNGTRICVRRLDFTSGWAYNFNIQCNRAGLVTIGPSMRERKCVTVDEYLTCASYAADIGFRVNQDDDDGKFDVTTQGPNVCVRRIDRIEGWRFPLVIRCNLRTGQKAESIGAAGSLIKTMSSRRRRENWIDTALVGSDPQETNIIRHGMPVWLEHVQYKWVSCPHFIDCTPAENSAPEHFRFFVDLGEASSPIESGKDVYIRNDGNGMYMTCNKVCVPDSSCPDKDDSTSKSRFSGCGQQRFRIYNSRESAATDSIVRDGDVIWLEHSSGDFISCPSEGDPCIASGVCPGGSYQRSFSGDRYCQPERFRVYQAHVDSETSCDNLYTAALCKEAAPVCTWSAAGCTQVRLQGKPNQLVEVTIGASPKSVKCVGYTGSLVTCGINAADQWVRKDNHDVPINFTVSVHGSLRNDMVFEVCVQRKQAATSATKKDGWDFNLVIACSRTISVPSWPHDVAAVQLAIVRSQDKSLEQERVEWGQRQKANNRMKSALSEMIGAPLQAPNPFGMANCPCVNQNLGPFVNFDGLQVKYANGTDVGSSCQAWDNGKYPGLCENSKQTPGKDNGWCALPWCYVDPCNCNVAEPPLRLASPKTYFPKTSQKSIFYSYATCGVEFKDFTGQTECVSKRTDAECGALEGCVWTPGKKCMTTETANHCYPAQGKNRAVASTGKNTEQSVTTSASGERCWKPATTCVSGEFFTEMSIDVRLAYTDCVELLVDSEYQAWCGSVAPPGINRKEDLRRCSRVNCDEICYQPHPDCGGPSTYQGVRSAGCFQEDGRAWCSKVNDMDAVVFAVRDWAWCSQIACDSACWMPSSSCVFPFQYRGVMLNDCYQEPGGRQAWCATKSEITDGDPDWIACKMERCSTARAAQQRELIASGHPTEPTTDLLLRSIGPGFEERGRRLTCNDGIKLYSGKEDLGACAKKCQRNTMCASFTFSAAEGCDACAMSTALCKETQPSMCDPSGMVVTFTKIPSRSGISGGKYTRSATSKAGGSGKKIVTEVSNVKTPYVPGKPMWRSQRSQSRGRRTALLLEGDKNTSSLARTHDGEFAYGESTRRHKRLFGGLKKQTLEPSMLYQGSKSTCHKSVCLVGFFLRMANGKPALCSSPDGCTTAADLDECCLPASPCSSLSTCGSFGVRRTDPNLWCATDRCSAEDDFDRCCDLRAQCSEAQFCYWPLVQTMDFCAGPTCGWRDIMGCCRPPSYSIYLLLLYLSGGCLVSWIWWSHFNREKLQKGWEM